MRVSEGGNGRKKARRETKADRRSRNERRNERGGKGHREERDARICVYVRLFLERKQEGNAGPKREREKEREKERRAKNG